MKKKVVIFGAGYHGRNALRVCIRKKIKVLNFVDNDKKLNKKKILNIHILNPQTLKGKKFVDIIFCGRHIKTQMEQCIKYGINKNRFIYWGKKDLRLDNKNFLNRNSDYLETIKFIDKNLNRLKIDFWVDAGSLLCLARNQEFAEFSDIDLLIDFNHFSKLKLFLKKININEYILKKKLVFYSTLLRKKLYQFVLSKKPKNSNYEPAIVEFNILVKKNKFFENIALKKDVSNFDWKRKKLIKYHGINLPVINTYKNYLEFIYGKSWKIKKNFYIKN